MHGQWNCERIHLFYSDFALGPYYMSSSDGGTTWTVPVRGTGPMRDHGAGMNGVQLAGGRLVVPCEHDDGTKATCYSDDHAQTWTIGQGLRVAPVEQGVRVAPVEQGVRVAPVEWREATGRARRAALTVQPLRSRYELNATDLAGCGETSIALDGRGPRTLTLLCRLGTSALVNHAIATSEDGGESWGPAVPLSAVMGPTCQGSVGLHASGRAGTVLVSAPFSADGGLSGRENLALWAVDMTQAKLEPVLKGRLWGCKAAYSAFSQDGTMNLFEAGETYRYEAIVLATGLEMLVA